MIPDDYLRDDPEPVPPERVLRYWLGQEVEDEEGGPDPDALGTEPALREELFERIPIAERAFAPDPADWYRVNLSEEVLRDLRVVVGEPEQGWRELANDDRIESVARRIRETDDLSALEEQSGKDLEKVRGIADDIEDEGPQGLLVVVREGEDPAYVADGNHRAAAYLLYLLRGGEFEGQEAYLGLRE
ncbi:hypothetical protein [Halorussus salinus]|uniref:hypothetical protein n=1 Tax=Halorussus salinus TaxID=1364935 RepID=UPI0010930035|nr:hypothetical protein [Halorussus salinus]